MTSFMAAPFIIDIPDKKAYDETQLVHTNKYQYK